LFGRHVLSFGAEYNHIEQFVFASFFGLAPRLTANRTTSTRAFSKANPFSSNGDQDPLNYPLNQLVLGNRVGFFSEKPALGFPHGGNANHRPGFSAHDTGELKKLFTANFVLR